MAQPRFSSLRRAFFALTPAFFTLLGCTSDLPAAFQGARIDGGEDTTGSDTAEDTDTDSEETDTGGNGDGGSVDTDETDETDTGDSTDTDETDTEDVTDTDETDTEEVTDTDETDTPDTDETETGGDTETGGETDTGETDTGETDTGETGSGGTGGMGGTSGTGGSEEVGGSGGDAGTPDIEAGAPPVLQSAVPANKANEIALDQDIILTFDQPVFPDPYGEVELWDMTTTESLGVLPLTDDAVTFDGEVMTVDWPGNFASSATFGITIGAGAIEGATGVGWAGVPTAGEYTFSTVALDGLVLSSTSPANNEIDVPVNAPIVLTFSSSVLLGAPGSLELVNVDTPSESVVIDLADTEQVQIADSVMTIDPNEDLSYLTNYYLTLDAGALQNGDGVAFEGITDDSVLSFSTEAPPSLQLVSTTPADNAVNVDPDTSVVFYFNESIEAGSGTIAVRRSTDDAVAATASIADAEVTISTDTLTYALPSTLDSSTEYYVTITAGSVVSALGAPFAGISNATDFSFTTTDAPLAPLLLTAVSPADDAVDVDKNADITFTFDQDIRLGTGTIALYEAATGTLVESTDVLDSRVTLTVQAATFDPDTTLSPDTEYYVVVTAGTFESLDGASFAGITAGDAQSFTVAATPFALVSLSPTNGEADVDPATDLVLTFSSAAAAGSGNIELYRDSGDLLIESVSVGDARVTIAGTEVRVDLDSVLSSDVDYYVLVDDGALVQDVGTETFAGMQNSGDWTFTTDQVTFPGGVSSGLVLWLDADYSESLKAPSGVSYWADRSGQHNDVTQTTTAERPTVVANEMNSRDVVRFDGTDDFMEASSGLNLSTYDGFIVWKSSSVADTDSWQILLKNGYNFEVNHGHPFLPKNVASCFGDCDVSGDAVWRAAEFATASESDDPHLWNFGFDPVTTSLFTRSQGGMAVFQPSPTTTPEPPVNPFEIGGSIRSAQDEVFAAADIGEVLIYSRMLSDSERSAIVSALRTKWGFGSPSCESGESASPSGGCFYLSGTLRTYDDARTACQARGPGWDLATIRSAAENNAAIALLASGNLEAWIGANDAGSNGVWRWVTDTAQFWSGDSAASGGGPVGSAFADFADGEPSAGAEENCGRYRYFDGEHHWGDIGCTENFRGLCEGPR